jgi:hypothetical protein
MLSVQESSSMNQHKPIVPGDRRFHERRDCRADIEWSFFNRRERFDGLMMNFSEAGAYIESFREMKTGATIFLHTGRVIIACEKTDGCLPPNATLLAEVKWGGSYSGESGMRRYGAGIRYHL